MAAMALTDEQLQNSLATSDDDGEFEEDDEMFGDMLMEHADTLAANKQLQNGLLAEHGEHEKLESLLDDEEEEMSSGEETASSDEEDDIELPDSPEKSAEEESDEDEDEDEEDSASDEDVRLSGAVKIRPRRLHGDAGAESGSEDESVASAVDEDESKNSSEAEPEAEWEPNANEEEEAANPNRCVFCQQDEENDPSEEFELYLACGVCGDNAHRQCARVANALKSDDETEVWFCPECVANKLVPEVVPAEIEEEQLDAAARRISRDQIAGNLLPSQRAVKPDSHSVFNTLIDPDDPLDGSRLLRKRKTSTEVVEHVDGKTSAGRRKPHEKQSRDKKSQDAKPNGVLPKTTSLPGTGDNEDAPSTPSRASRSLRPKVSMPAYSASIVSATKRSIKLCIRLNSSDLARIESIDPNPTRRKKKKHRGVASTRADVPTSAFLPSTYSQPFYSLHDREVDELKSKPYGGILTEQEADTSLTLPRPEHRRQFDEARQKAEEEWKARVAIAAEAALASGVKKPRKVSGPASQIEYIEFGQYQIDIWYAAPYPEEYSRNKALFICEFCLKYMESDIVAWRHKTKCPWKHPPGDEIYRDGKVMIFEVDGRKNPLYCQNLCLLAKLFLGSKTLYYDVEPFLFYVMTEYDEYGCHFVGYFSKEKRPSSQNNVSCILVLPIHQRKGYGHLLIDFSYLLTRVEKKTGSPEKPLSDMGLVSYRNYWRLVLCYQLRNFKSGDQIPSIKEMSNKMGLTPDDMISALDALGALVRDSQTGVYALRLQPDYYHEVIKQHESKGYASLNEKALVWTPYVMGRGNASAFEHAPPMNTMAPRDDEDEDMLEESQASSTGKRDFDTFSGTNGDTGGLNESLEQLTTDAGEPLRATYSIDGSLSSKTNGVSKKLSYYEAAASIPATRFEIFPPLPASKSRGTPRPPAPRASVSRSRSTRPTPRRSSTSYSTRRSTPRTTSGRRKTGGTGRGPGRWPKGTKKSDFGNAESAPGLPPSMLKSRSRLNNEVFVVDDDEPIETEADDDGEDEIEEEDNVEAIVFDTPAMKKRRSDSRRGQGLGKPSSTMKGELRVGEGKTILPPIPGDEDEIMADIVDEDLDAEGEDE